jgi:ribonuclease T2
MHRLLWTLLIAVGFSVPPASGEGERAGAFDYYVMSLSWSPNWCALEGDARKSEQCDDRHDFGWTLHGLWPQHERGWPTFCRANEATPSRTMTGAMADIMGTQGLAWYQWKKHGKCSGLSAQKYYRLAREAFGSIKKPEILRKLDHTVQLPASVIEDAFLEANPTLLRDQITITCQGNYIQEARICLTKDLKLRRCGADVLRDCTLQKAIFTPVR